MEPTIYVIMKEDSEHYRQDEPVAVVYAHTHLDALMMYFKKCNIQPKDEVDYYSKPVVDIIK